MLCGFLLCATVFVALSAPVQIRAQVSQEHRVVRGANGVLYVSTELNNTTPQPQQSTTTTAITTDTIKDTQTEAATPSADVSPITIPQGFFTSIAALFNGLLRIVFLIAALLAFFHLIRAGFIWITSGGDRGKLESARNSIIAAVLGLIIVSASYAVLTVLLQFLGFESINELLQRGLARQ